VDYLGVDCVPEFVNLANRRIGTKRCCLLNAVTDPLQSTSVVLDGAGNVVEMVSYEPYGGVRTRQTFDPLPSDTIIPWADDFLFNGKEWDIGYAAGIDVYDFGARLYLADVGRWLDQDSSFQDGLNRYAFVRNNPVNYRDPDGHSALALAFSLITMLTGCDGTSASAGPVSVGDDSVSVAAGPVSHDFQKESSSLSIPAGPMTLGVTNGNPSVSVGLGAPKVSMGGATLDTQVSVKGELKVLESDDPYAHGTATLTVSAGATVKAGEMKAGEKETLYSESTNVYVRGLEPGGAVRNYLEKRNALLHDE
jgi:RHS repeat-associated protein